MMVKLLHASPIGLADKAIGKCWDKTTDTPAKRMYRVANKFKHASTIEHVNYTFDIDGVSRALLQELARHRMQSLSVKSSRYTLKELKTTDNVAQFLVSTGDMHMDGMNQEHLKYIQGKLVEGVPNDVAKYMLPEAYKTSLVSTMNMRALQNFLSLRTDKSALKEIRQLAHKMFEVLPKSHKFMVVDYVKEEDDV